MFKLNETISCVIKQSGIKVRPNASPGVWLTFLLPAAFVISCIKHPQETSHLFKLCSCLSLGLAATSVIFIIQCVRKKPLAVIRTLYLIPAAITATILKIWLHTGLMFNLLSGLMSSICFWHIMILIFNKFSYSFSVGELLIVSQAIMLFLYGTIINVCISIINIPIKDMDIATLVLQIGLCAIGLIVVLMDRFKGLRSPYMFYMVSGSVIFFLIIIFLTALLRQMPLVWLLDFLFRDINRIKMMIYWAGCSVAAAIAINKQIQGATRATPAVRKVFHIFAVAVYLPGLFYECTFIYLASGVVLGIFGMLEMLRILKIPPLYDCLQKGFDVYRDDKDTGAVALTPIYLLVGCSLPLWLHPAPCDILDSVGFNLLPLTSGVLAIGIGDTVASIVGTTIGKHYWPGTKKTMEGTIGCILSQAIVAYVLINLGFIHVTQYELIRTFSAIIVGSLVEATTTQIDNLVLPLILYLILC